MSKFIICDAQSLQGSKQLLILDQAQHNTVNGSIGFVVMIDLHKETFMTFMSPVVMKMGKVIAKYRLSKRL